MKALLAIGEVRGLLVVVAVLAVVCGAAGAFLAAPDDPPHALAALRARNDELARQVTTFAQRLDTAEHQAKGFVTRGQSTVLDSLVVRGLVVVDEKTTPRIGLHVAKGIAGLTLYGDGQRKLFLYSSIPEASTVLSMTDAAGTPCVTLSADARLAALCLSTEGATLDQAGIRLLSGQAGSFVSLSDPQLDLSATVLVANGASACRLKAGSKTVSIEPR